MNNALSLHGLKLVGKHLVADGKNAAAAQAFVETLRASALECEQRAGSVTPSKARELQQNARAARRDADRIEASIR